MGVVYHAWDQVDNRYLAIKVLLPKEAWEIDASTYYHLLERFTRERQILINLRHQHIVPLYDIGQYDEMMYFVMQYCSGGTLYQKLHQTEKTSFPEVLRYITQAASALDFIHDNNIVHRDIKPQNFLLDAVGKLLLTDFGISHIVGSTLTTSGQFWGTGAYASPQAQKSETPDPRDDIYSLGVVLYEMVTGNNPRMLRKLRQDIPPEVDKVISKATARGRKDRYDSAGAMVKDLDHAIKDGHLDGVETALPPMPSWTETERAFHYDRVPHQQASSNYKDVLFRSLPLLSRLPRFASISIAIVLVLLVFVAIGIFANPFIQRTPTTTNIIFFPSSTDSPTPSSIETAKEAVQAYYLDWNSRNYQAAYQLLQMSYQQRFPYQVLLTDYQHTHYACITIEDAAILNDSSIQVTVTDNAIEDAPSGQGTVINRYRVVYIVDQEQGMWKLAPESLLLESTHGTCHTP